MAITATIPTMTFPKREDCLDPDEWVTQAETAYDVLSGSFTTNTNLLAEQANALETNVNDKELSATTASTNASNSATSASNSATTATNQANIAVAAVATLPAGTINDLLIEANKTWSSFKIDDELNNTQAANKTYVDTQITGLGTAATKNVGTSAGQVMEVGAFGLGMMEAPPILWNIADVYTLPSGFYKWVAGVNSPSAYGSLVQVRMQPDRTAQISIASDSADITFSSIVTGILMYSVKAIHTGNVLQTTGTSAKYPMSQKAVTDAMITEKVYNLTGTAINPANGTIQYKTVSSNTTFTETLTAGQSVILRLISANSYTITFPTITWVGVTAPVLTANCAIVLWKEQSSLYGAYVGSLV